MRYRMIAVCILLVCPVVMADAKLDDVKKKIAERSAKHNSVQFKMEMTSDMSQPGMTMKSKSNSTMKYMKKGDKMLSRVEMNSVMVMKGPMDQTVESKGTSVVDGEFMWSYSESMGNKSATKMKVPENQKNQFDPSAGWEQFHIALKDDEAVGDAKCWVIEMTPKDAALKAQMSKSVTYYDQKTGLMAKQIGYDGEGKVMSTMTVSDVKINEKIDPKVFTFTPPPGVQVQDMTNAQNPPAAGLPESDQRS